MKQYNTGARSGEPSFPESGGSGTKTSVSWNRLERLHTIADLYVVRRYSGSHDQRASEPGYSTTILYQAMLRTEWSSGPAFNVV